MTARFAPEPDFSHGQASQTAILYCNLGTPDAATPTAVRRFLAQFLSDPRVVEIPRFIWLLILHGIILRVRPAQSATKYASIWLPLGSPLKIWTEKQGKLLQDWLTQCGHHVLVRYAMRYGQTSIAEQLDALKAAGATRILIIPAYPQYSATTTASLFDATYQWAARTRSLPELRFVNHYHDHPLYIAALAAKIERFWADRGRPNVLLMSFHGVPQRTLELGDPYHCECLKTARLLAQALGLTQSQFKISFQSRLGRAKWLQPYTEPSLKLMASEGVERVDVVCPAFICDCLETLEEIDLEGRRAFLRAGGKEFHYIACLNDDAAWINALGSIAEQHLQGWPSNTPTDTADLAACRRAALTLGATR